jgi:uncharacterized protein YcbK (DUF882 family)
MKLTENFSLDEFRSKDGSEFPDHVVSNIKRLANNLQKLRDHLGQRITINSGYRSPAHNRKIGGAINSTHMQGMAADIVVNGVDPIDVAASIEKLIELGEMEEGGLKAYQNFTHYDIRGIKTRW